MFPIALGNSEGISGTPIIPSELFSVSLIIGVIFIVSFIVVTFVIFVGVMFTVSLIIISLLVIVSFIEIFMGLIVELLSLTPKDSGIINKARARANIANFSPLFFPTNIYLPLFLFIFRLTSFSWPCCKQSKWSYHPYA